MKTICWAACLALASAASGAEPADWDAYPVLIPVGQSSTVVTTSGHRYSGAGVLFAPDDVTVLGPDLIVPRSEVKEVILRWKRDGCCDALWVGTELLLLGADGMVHGYVALGIEMVVFGAPVAAATLPIALAIETVRCLNPRRVRVVP